jgi:hypothetical protein
MFKTVSNECLSTRTGLLGLIIIHTYHDADNDDDDDTRQVREEMRYR